MHVACSHVGVGGLGFLHLRLDRLTSPNDQFFVCVDDRSVSSKKKKDDDRSIDPSAIFCRIGRPDGIGANRHGPYMY